MPQKESMAVPEGNDPIPHVWIRGTLEDLRQIMSEAMDKSFDKHLGKKPENSEDLGTKDQCEASLVQEARQPRLAVVADGHADKRTRERTEGAAKAVQTMHRDSFSAGRVNLSPKTNSTSFGVKVDPLPCMDDIVVENGTAAPKSCPPLETHTTTAAGGLLPTGKTSTATKTTFIQPPLRLHSTKETNVWISVPSA